MKRPKPNYKRPQLWIGVPKCTMSGGYQFRIRILYPDGSAEWCDGSKAISEDFMLNPCWSIFYVREGTSIKFMGITKTIKESIKRMKQYDKITGRKTIFIANL